MTQGIQISMLMTGADTALKSDASLYELDIEGQGMIFGELLGDIVQPAKASPGDSKLRQLPAGIALSQVSQALLLAATEDSETGDNLSESDSGTLLASSLLGQIALKDKARVADNSASAELELESSGHEADAEQTGISAETVLSPNTDHVSNVDNDKVTPLPTGTVDVVDVKHSANVQLSEKTASTTTEASNNTELLANRLDKPEFTGNTQMTSLKAQSKIDKAIPIPPEIVLPAGILSSHITDDSVESVENAAVALQLEPKVNNELVSSAQVIVAGKPKQELAPVQSMGQPLIETETQVNISATPMVADKAMLLVGAEQANKTDSASIGSDKLTQKVLPEKADNGSGSKAGSEQSSQQNSQRQHPMVQQLVDAQSIAADNSNATATKAAPESVNVRTDTLFNASLQAAEARQHSTSSITAKDPAEQLRQSLNLLQQDAPNQLRERVNLMVRQNIQVAEIRLDPAGLGQMQIKIEMQQEQASVQFVVQQPQAKELLEQQLPRLREMLQQQGILLSEGNVQQQSQQQERQLAQHNGGGNKQHAETEELHEQPHSTVQVTASVNERLVDYYA
jgi:flagellar hook-length control protein FliK